MLDAHVLVLNKSWVAVHIASARRALSLLFAGSARAVHPGAYSLHAFDDWLVLSSDGMEGSYVRTPNLRIRIPEVILLNHFNGYVRHKARLSRHSIYERDLYTCQYCGRALPKGQLTIDHVMPQSRGGDDSWDNLVVACTKCNVTKGSQTPEEASMALLRRPVRPDWLPRCGAHIPDAQIAVWQRFMDTSGWVSLSRIRPHG